MKHKLDSEALMTRAASGDAAAFRSLLDTHYDRVFRVVYSVVRNQSDAEDITQDIWASLPAALARRGESHELAAPYCTERGKRCSAKNGHASANNGWIC